MKKIRRLILLNFLLVIGGWFILDSIIVVEANISNKNVSEYISLNEINKKIAETKMLKKIAEEGYTAWTLTNTGKIRSRHKATIVEIVDVCLDERF